MNTLSENPQPVDEAEERPLYDLRAIMRATGMIRPESEEPYPLDDEPSCEQCGAGFKRRSSGGKKQRFCSPACRQAYHAGERPAEQREQRSTLGTTLVAIPQPPERENDSEDVNSGFEWSDEDSVVLNERRRVAVYFNQSGDVVMREESADSDSDEDHFIVIGRQNMPKFIGALKRIQKAIEEGGPR
jgi:hypothetical protein